MNRERTPKSSRRVFSLRPGMDLHIADFTPADTLEQGFESVNPVLRFYFHVAASGYWELHAPYRNSRETRIEHSDRLGVLLFYPEMEGTMHMPANLRQFHLSISITPSLLNTLLDGQLERLPKDLRDVAEGCRKTGFCYDGRVSRVMNTAIHQLLHSPYTGPLDRMYTESKAIELVAHKLAQIRTTESRTDAQLKLTLDDVDRVNQAREILFQDLESPPRLLDLARTVGTNHSKLNQAFREMFGTTAFGCLRQMRLVEARRLLEEEGMNVTETALTVGYSSLPSFSKAFSEFFGQNPAKCSKGKR